MYKKLFKPTFSTSANKGLFSIVKKGLYFNPKAPSQEDYLAEVKDWLKRTNPQLLCIYFSNDWNPVSIKAEEGYRDFVRKNSKAVHLKINSDKFPKLRWFFDAKMEPSMKLYYHGAQMKSVGGCNFDKFSKDITRTFEHVNQDYSPSGSYNQDYEMPYYKWEADLDYKGAPEEFESSGSFVYIGFRGMYQFRAPPGETYLTHERMRK